MSLIVISLATLSSAILVQMNFSEWGFIGLFIASFLAATILPLSSEIVISALLFNGLNPSALVLIATVGNVLGSLVNYALGFYGAKALIQKVLSINDQAFFNAEQRYKKYGTLALLFAWVPIIGDPLTVIAGLLRVNVLWFILLVSIGKLTRYIVVSYFVLL